MGRSPSKCSKAWRICRPHTVVVAPPLHSRSSSDTALESVHYIRWVFNTALHYALPGSWIVGHVCLIEVPTICCRNTIQDYCQSVNVLSKNFRSNFSATFLDVCHEPYRKIWMTTEEKLYPVPARKIILESLHGLSYLR